MRECIWNTLSTFGLCSASTNRIETRGGHRDGEGLEQVMYGERLITGFVQYGEEKASGRGSTKGQMDSDSSVVHSNEQ